jgi:transcriptional regulator with XRE-family HTH domain
VAKPNVETLSQYVARIIKEKGLKQDEVGKLSGGKITDGYVRSILTERATNPSIQKLQALARGLGVSEEEIFRVARGLSAAGESDAEEERSNYHVVLTIMCASLKNRTLTDLLHEVAKLPPESQEEAVKLLKYLNERRQVSPRKRRSG